VDIKLDNKLIEENNKLRQELSRVNFEKERAMQERDRFFNELTETRNSKTYKIARSLTEVSRFIKGQKYIRSRVYGTQKVYPYMISAVMAIYNTKEFLEEMVDSVIAQKQDVLAKYLKSCPDSMYRENAYDNIYELILVDDGSNDGSGEICDLYAAKYPWVKVLHKENGGVSTARNAGVELATGKYITFPDADDRLDVNVFEDCFLFFENHENELSMVTYPLRFFDAQSGDHWTTYRFNEGTRIIDMQDEWDKPQYFTNATFYKAESIQNKIFFDSNIVNGEDIVFNHQVMCQDGTRVGLISTCTYWYRRRSIGQPSVIQQSKQTEKHYISYVTDMLGSLEKNAKERYGSFPKYVQYAVMGQIQWRLRADPRGEEAREVVGEEGFQEYKKLIKDMIKRLDLDVIMAQKQLYREHFFYLGRIKTDNNIQREYSENNISYSFDGVPCYDAASSYMQLEFMSIQEGKLMLEGIYTNLEDGFNLWLEIAEIGQDVSENTSKIRIPIEVDLARDANIYILDDIAMYVSAFKVSIPLDLVTEKSEIVFGETYDGHDVIKTQVRTHKFMPITKNFSMSYYSHETWTVRLEGNKLIVWNMLSLDSKPAFEEEFQKQVLGGRFGKENRVINAISIRKEALGRLAWKQSSNKKIWLISDRYSRGDDNGEAMFLHLMKNPIEDVLVYFIIDRDAEDYERLSKIGPVLAQDSREHRIMHLLADCIISSQGDEYIIDPFWREGPVRDIFKDFLCRNKYVFLCHGVLKDDLSSWLNRYNKKINGFICTAPREAQAVREGDYYYDEEVWLTGMPRLDRLYHDEQKLIMVMPTWRKWLMQDFNAAASDKDANRVMDGIEQTEFFEFYHALLNDKRLLDECDKYGYKLCYMPHTLFRECMDKFCDDKRIVQFDLTTPYREAFAKANLIISDYSSTPMDFAYLRKPVVYAQFDKEKFFSGVHTYKQGYYDYEEDGFGEVVYDIETLIDTVISYIHDDCKIKGKYLDRINSFFAYDDQNNCARVCEKLVELMDK